MRIRGEKGTGIKKRKARRLPRIWELKKKGGENEDVGGWGFGCISKQGSRECRQILKKVCECVGGVRKD